LENAIVIHVASNSIEGVKTEYQYLSEKFGHRGLDWNLKEQSLIKKGSKQYDKFDIELKDGASKTIYFDITEFYSNELKKLFGINTGR